MPGKMTKSILRPPFRPPRYRQPSAARVYLAGRSEKRKIFTSAPESSGESRFNGIADVMQAIANSEIEINEVRPQDGKLVGGKLREKLALVRYRW